MNFLRISSLLLLISLGWGAGGGFGPAAANASCGDYVHLGNGRGPLATASAANLAGAVDGPRELPGSNSPPRESPGCQGPSCRGALPPSPFVPSLETSPEQRELLAVTTSDLDRDSPNGLVLEEREVAIPNQREGRWERPPRAEG